MPGNRITAAHITPYLSKISDPLPRVLVAVDGESKWELFEFFPDEIYFTPDEFVGLSISKAWHLKRVRDSEYLKGTQPRVTSIALLSANTIRLYLDWGWKMIDISFSTMPYTLELEKIPIINSIGLSYPLAWHYLSKMISK